MNTVDAIFCADTHLQNRAWAGLPELHGDSYYAFSQIVDMAIERGVGCILAGGDIIDKKINSSEIVAFLVKQMDKLQEAGIRIYYIQGDHDLSSPPWLAALHSWPQCVHDKTIRLDSGLTLRGLDYSRPGEFRQAIANLPKSDILLTHQKWAEFLGNVAVCDASFVDVPHVSKILTGDYHKCFVEEYLGKHGQPIQVVSPGATCMQAIDSPHIHYVAALEGDAVTMWSLKSRRVIEPKVISDEDRLAALLTELDDVLDQVDTSMPENIRKPIIIVKFASRIQDAYKRLCKLIDNRGFLFATTFSTEEEKEKKTTERRVNSLQGGLDLIIPDRESAMYGSASALLAADSAKETLHNLKERWLRNATETAAT